MSDSRRSAKKKKSKSNMTAMDKTVSTASGFGMEATPRTPESQMPASEQAADTTQPVTSFLTFSIGGELLALPLACAKEIARCETITKIPNTPSCLRGVTNLRGSVVPIVDLAPRLGRADTAIGPRTCIVMIDVDWSGEILTMGLLVEGVGHVMAVPTDAVDAPPPFGTRLRPELLTGLVPAGDTFAAVLNADRALAAQELLVSTSDRDPWPPKGKPSSGGESCV